MAYATNSKRNECQRAYRARVKQESPAAWREQLEKKRAAESLRRAEIQETHAVDPNYARERKRERNFRSTPRRWNREVLELFSIASGPRLVEPRWKVVVRADGFRAYEFWETAEGLEKRLGPLLKMRKVRLEELEACA